MTRTWKPAERWEAFKMGLVTIFSFFAVAPLFKWMFQLAMAALSDYLSSSQVGLLTSLLAIAVGFGIALPCVPFVIKSKSDWVFMLIGIPALIGLGFIFNGAFGVVVSVGTMLIESFQKALA